MTTDDDVLRMFAEADPARRPDRFDQTVDGVWIGTGDLQVVGLDDTARLGDTERSRKASSESKMSQKTE